MPMKNPPHPGRSIKLDCLDPLGLTITEGAKVLGVARSTLSRVINGQAAITPEMAIRLSKAFGSTPETWLKMQQAYDLAQMRAREDEIVVERYTSTRQEETFAR
jgi:addiction module HigA family antidote